MDMADWLTIPFAVVPKPLPALEAKVNTPKAAPAQAAASGGDAATLFSKALIRVSESSLVHQAMMCCSPMTSHRAHPSKQGSRLLFMPTGSQGLDSQRAGQL